MSNSGVMLAGWLRKSPPERKLHKNAWKKRWFVLRSGRLTGDPNLLEYYKHQGSKKPIRSISLDECSQIDANVPIKYERKDPTQQYVFDIVTKTRTYYLVAGSNLEMSSWVRYLCDLCGFNHDNPENQHNLSSQQQTFKAVQPLSRYQNGNSSLIADEQEPPMSGEVPVPLPRPRNTLTKRSVPIHVTDASVDRDDDVGGSASAADSPTSPRRVAPTERAVYNFHTESSLQDAESEYLHLSDFKTAPEPAEQQALLSVAKLSERRVSTDSVFTHEGASDGASDVILEQPMQTVHMRFQSNIRKGRLDSMPDCPPPPPPIKAPGGCFETSLFDDRGYSYPPDDSHHDDVVVEARRRSCRSNQGLSPIDDSEINRVPLNMQREFRVDDMGNPLPAFSSPSSRFSDYKMSAAFSSSDYVNTADATAEVKVSGFSPTQGHEASVAQVFPVVGRPFTSPTNMFASPHFTNSSVFFNSPTQTDAICNSPRALLYDLPSPIPAYASPRAQQPHVSPLAKGSLYSSASTLSPYWTRGSPQKINSPHFLPQTQTPKMRRSSSVGQLENVANDLAADIPGYHPGRRRSIDQRRNHPVNVVSPPPLLTPFAVPPSLGTDKNKLNMPPPRPPKSEATVSRIQGNPPAERLEASEYFNLQSGGDGGLPSSHGTVGVGGCPPDSPPHTEVVTVRDDSPQHTELLHNDKEDASTSTARLASCSTESTASSESKSLSMVYDLPSSNVRRPVERDESLYDTPSRSNALHAESLYDTPTRSNASTTSPLYDAPKKASHSEEQVQSNCNSPKPTSIKVETDIDETLPNYEVMLDQDSLPLTGIDDVQLYTCMAGASTLNSPTFPVSPLGRPITVCEPPPVKRDLKPGRKSLGSDGGSSDVKRHHSRNSFEDALVDVMTGGMPSHSSDSPVSPPHALIMHTTPIIKDFDLFPATRSHDRLLPPERPPKHMNQPTLSPRTPPSATMTSHVPARSYAMTHSGERQYKFEGQAVHSPSLVARQRSSANPVPGRPPKPISMQQGTSPAWDEPGHPGMYARDITPNRPPKSSSVFHQDFPSGPHIFPKPTAIVPPPPMEHIERELKYVELTDFPTSSGDGPAGGAVEPSERVAPRADGVVEYIVLDAVRTEALQKMKQEREKELSQQKRGAAENKSVKK